MVHVIAHSPSKVLEKEENWSPPAPCTYLKTKSISVMASCRKISLGIYSLLIILCFICLLYSQRLCLKCGQQPPGCAGSWRQAEEHTRLYLGPHPKTGSHPSFNRLGVIYHQEAKA